MIYREFGKTGVQVSALGFGCMRFPVLDNDNSQIDEELATEMIHMAIENGVNYFDTAYPYHAENFSSPGNSEPFLGKVLKGYREKVYMATKLPCWLVESREDMDRILDEQLQRLDTEYIDFYLLHSLNRGTWTKMLKNGALDFLNDALKCRKIRYAGFSFHDDAGLFREIVDAWDWSFCQIMYNYFDEHFQAGREGLEYAAQKGLGVVAMEPLRGGALVSGLPGDALEVLSQTVPERSPVEWAFCWLWDQSGVSMVLSGMSTPEQVKENLELAGRVADRQLAQSEREAIEQVKRIINSLQKVNCTACGYCLPCPEGVNIPRNFALCNEHYMLKDPAAKSRYISFLGESQRASACIACGECLEKCPQQIDIPDQMQHVAQLFSVKD